MINIADRRLIQLDHITYKLPNTGAYYLTLFTKIFPQPFLYTE